MCVVLWSPSLKISPSTVNTYLFGLVTFQFAKYYRTSEFYTITTHCMTKVSTVSLTEFDDPPAIKCVIREESIPLPMSDHYIDTWSFSFSFLTPPIVHREYLCPPFSNCRGPSLIYFCSVIFMLWDYVCVSSASPIFSYP